MSYIVLVIPIYVWELVTIAVWFDFFVLTVLNILRQTVTYAT
jgi:hypothetical protein